jgi:hypothetical protein
MQRALCRVWLESYIYTVQVFEDVQRHRYFVPLDALLWLGLGGRLAASVMLIGTPIFFASLIFSHSFREAPSPAAAFGSNLVGVVIGGSLEYTSMIFGLDFLYLLAFAIYDLSWLSDGWSQRALASSGPDVRGRLVTTPLGSA